MELTIEEKLKMPFPAKKIHFRVGARTKAKDKGLPLAYIDARDVMQRLDDLFGITGWSDRYFETEKGRIICELSILVDGGWIMKSDGAGDTGTEGEKGAISDAFKRAAVKFGIGRYLYSVKLNWLPIDQYGKFTQEPQLPSWATPEGYTEILKNRKGEEK